MINLCLVVIATQFSETKQRESQLMKEQRVRFMSNASTLASFSEPGSCYDELLKYLVYIIRKATRQLGHLTRAAARRAGIRICASPTPEPPNVKKRRHRKRQGSIHHLVHHHHHHHHHYHLGNGNIRGDGAQEMEVPSRNNNRNGAGTGRLTLPTIVPLQDTSPSCAAALGSSSAESIHSTFHTTCHLEPHRAPTLGHPVLQAYKRNSVPFAAPVHKNYPTLQPRVALEQLRQRALDPGGACCTANILSNLNIPPNPINTSQCLLDTQGPAGKWTKQGYFHAGFFSPFC